MKIGDARVATNNAHTHATYGTSPMSPLTLACRAMTNPSSPLPTIAHPTICARIQSGARKHPVTILPTTAGTAYPAPSPNPRALNTRVSGICVPTARKKTE